MPANPPGGATPTIVPLNACFDAGRAAGGAPPAPGTGTGAGGDAAGEAAGWAGASGVVAGTPDPKGPGRPGCWFTINTVPLNFGAAAAARNWKPHLLQVLTVSVFLVPQFGQNKSASRARGVHPVMQRCCR